MANVRCLELLEDAKWMLSKSGLWPIRRTTIYEILKFIYSFFADLFLFVFSSYNTVKSIKTADMRLLNLMVCCVLIPAVNYTAKAYTIMVNRNCLADILRDLDCDSFNVHSAQLNKHIQLIHTITKILLRYFILTLSLYIAVRSILPLLVNVGMIIPAPTEMGKYAVVYKIAHLFSTISASFNTVAFDVLYLTLMNVCIAQLDILQDKFKSIFEAKVRPIEEVNFITYRTVKECVILHETINKYVQKLNVLLSFPLFVQYSCGCFIICNTILQIQMSKPSDSTYMLGVYIFFSITFGQMAAYHYLGNEILFRSNKIIEATYVSEWYKLDIQSQRGLLLLMERAKRPLVIQVYKYFSISWDSLGVIFRWAYSIFAVLKVRYK